MTSHADRLAAASLERHRRTGQRSQDSGRPRSRRSTAAAGMGSHRSCCPRPLEQRPQRLGHPLFDRGLVEPGLPLRMSDPRLTSGKVRRSRVIRLNLMITRGRVRPPADRLRPQKVFTRRRAEADPVACRAARTKGTAYAEDPKAIARPLGRPAALSGAGRDGGLPLPITVLIGSS